MLRTTSLPSPDTLSGWEGIPLTLVVAGNPQYTMGMRDNGHDGYVPMMISGTEGVPSGAFYVVPITSAGNSWFLLSKVPVNPTKPAGDPSNMDVSDTNNVLGLPYDGTVLLPGYSSAHYSNEASWYAWMINGVSGEGFQLYVSNGGTMYYAYSDSDGIHLTSDGSRATIFKVMPAWSAPMAWYTLAIDARSPPNKGLATGFAPSQCTPPLVPSSDGSCISPTAPSSSIIPAEGSGQPWDGIGGGYKPAGNNGGGGNGGNGGGSGGGHGGDGGSGNDGSSKSVWVIVGVSFAILLILVVVGVVLYHERSTS